METRDNFYENQLYNVESQSLIDDLELEAQNKNYQFDKEKTLNVLKNFTKINNLRDGKNTGGFEDIKYILMSGDNNTRILAFNPLIKSNDINIPFATDIDFITNRLWFKLKKGLSCQHSLPRSLDVVAKAQVVISSQINNLVSLKYNDMKDQISKGELTKQEIEYMFGELRSSSAKPEDITAENIENDLKFLSLKKIEDHLREKSIIERRLLEAEKTNEEHLREKILIESELEEGRKAIKDLEENRLREKEKIKSRCILKKKFKFFILLFLGVVSIILLFLLSLYSINYYKSENDTDFALFGTRLTYILGTLPFFKFKAIYKWIKEKYNKSIKMCE